MIDAVFFYDGSLYTGFEISGHAMSAEYGRDLVCCAVSSAVYLTVNGISSVAGAPHRVAEKDGFLRLALLDGNESAQAMVKSLKLHLNELSKLYSENIRVRVRITKRSKNMDDWR